MIYYNIGRTNELDVIGQYPQTKEVTSSKYHIDNIDSAVKVNPNYFPDFKPKYGLELLSKSIATDVIDKGSLEFGFIVSEKLKKLLSDFNLPPHKFHSIDVYNVNTQYYWFQFVTDFESFFDVENSEVEIFDIFKQEVTKVITFNSLQEIIELNRKLVLQIGKTMRYKSIRLKRDFPHFDLFEIKGAKNFTLITDTLKRELESQNITGLEYLRYDKINLTPTPR